MSMTMLTILQIIWVSAAYLGTTLLLPWLLLRRRLAQFRLPARFMAYFMTGNFFCINLVYLLQLLHISSRGALIAGTLAPFLAAAASRRKRLLELAARGTDSMGSFSEGEVGVRTAALRIRENMQGYSSGWLSKWLAPRWLDVLLAAAVVLLVLFMYGINTVSVYGYCASDLVVHNYWINYMEANRIFVEGIYPFGFHCMIYYLHAVFAIPTYVLLRVFTVAQTLMIHLMLLAFLKLVCKSKYAPYAGMAAYLTTGVFYRFVYLRYYAPLPQEYGMIFILPAAYFAIAFLQNKDLASAAKKKGWAEGDAGYSLILFSMCVSMTLAAHFYDTVVTGLLCVGIGAGFCFRCLRWRYLKGLLLAGTAGLFIGVLPMAAAYAAGTPLHGSLYWGMNAISAEEEDVKRPETDGAPEAAEDGAAPDVPDASDASDGAAEARPGKLEHIIGAMQYYATNNSRTAAVFMLGSVAALLAMGLLWYILRRPDYGGVLVSFGVFMALMCLLQAAPGLGLPSLIEVSRWAVYIGYGLAAAWSLCIDGTAYLLFRERRAVNLAGLAGAAAACAAVALTGVRTPVCLSAYVPNGAVVCLTNILRENRDTTSWTICSADSERQMIWEHGYHYETINFLRGQKDLTGDTSLTIPTDTVYFFIEKVPILYYDFLNTVRPEREVSQGGAKQPLPAGDGIKPYIEDARWVTMSHMYYWAQAFQKLYPYEMEVYYETDDFICYRVRQDGYSLYNFAIDYGYNE